MCIWWFGHFQFSTGTWKSLHREITPWSFSITRVFNVHHRTKTTLSTSIIMLIRFNPAVGFYHFPKNVHEAIFTFFSKRSKSLRSIVTAALTHVPRGRDRVNELRLDAQHTENRNEAWTETHRLSTLVDYVIVQNWTKDVFSAINIEPLIILTFWYLSLPLV